MPRSSPVDGFQLVYDRAGSGPAVVLLHGWPTATTTAPSSPGSFAAAILERCQ
ncbi:MAG: alpha/beta fold hydrolase [Streptosporangiaceae bacterium]